MSYERTSVTSCRVRAWPTLLEKGNQKLVDVGRLNHAFLFFLQLFNNKQAYNLKKVFHISTLNGKTVDSIPEIKNTSQAFLI